MKFEQRVEPSTWVLGDLALAQGHAGIVFPSLTCDGGINEAIFTDGQGGVDTIRVNDPDAQLPQDQASWQS